ncbi:C45 family autoproteolytic acyltransferase/hydolase [Labrys neptuniae]
MIAPEPGVSLPIVLLNGTPFQRGLQHGTAFGDRIALALVAMRESHPAATLQGAREAARHSWSRLIDHAPAIAAEVQGMAEGAQCDCVDLYCHIGFEFFQAPAASGCSGLAFASPNGAIIGQNWDAPAEVHADLALFLHVGADGLEVAIVGSIGTLGWVGQNRFGLSLLTNDLMLDTTLSGLPSQVVRRMLLAEPDVPAALERLRHLPVMAGRCYLLGDRAGHIAAVELSPAAGVCALPAAPRIMHTNHALLAPTLAVEDETLLQAAYPSSRSRLEALKRSGSAVASAAGLMAALRDRSGAPDSVSKTPSSTEPTGTAFSVVFDCGQGVFHLCGGPPSAGPYQRFHWPVLSEEGRATCAAEPDSQTCPPQPGR